jgi:hypothetical protein
MYMQYGSLGAVDNRLRTVSMVLSKNAVLLHGSVRALHVQIAAVSHDVLSSYHSSVVF